MQLYFLGTSAGIPTPQRNVSSLGLIWPEYHGQTWLFDCGEGTQHQILGSLVRITRINRIFITHLHGDHIYGLPGLLGSRSFHGSQTPLTLYGPPGIKQFVHTALETSNTYLTYPLEIIDVEVGTFPIDDLFTLQIQKLAHGIDCYGYRIIEKDQPGQLDASRLKAMGIQPGPIYGELKEGKSVTLDDGRTIHGADFLSPPKKGRVITILGDTQYTVHSVNLAQDADILVHESTYRAHQQNLASKYNHSTSVDAARVAREANVRHLILTHISARFTNEECQELLKEAQSIFPNTSLAYDGYLFEYPS